jgi:hypothetical protein
VSIRMDCTIISNGVLTADDNVGKAFREMAWFLPRSYIGICLRNTGANQ